MNKLISLVGLSMLLTGCAGHVKVGYILEAGGAAEWMPVEESNA